MLLSRQGEKATFRSSPPIRVALVFAALTALGVWTVAPHVLLSAALDGVAAAVILLPAILAGLWLVPVFRLGQLPLRWHLLLGASLGLGAISLLVVLLGLYGVLQRGVWISLLSVFVVAGIIRLRILLRNGPREERSSSSVESSGATRAGTWLWLVLVPFAVLAIFAAANAPGFIWAEEGFGYDVLEYHLQMPKEYLQSGRITYSPHNVYANFPMNVEMLFLLAMIMHGEVYDIGTTANMIHLLLGALAVSALWVVGREWAPRAGQLTAIAFGSVGWLAYLSGLAYVEHGMLLFTATALASLLRAVARPEHRGSRGWIAMAGVCSGLACGCKYTAVLLTALPLAVAMLLWFGGTWRRRGLDLFVYLLAAAMSFAPWLTKNELMTGNPVFPLLNGLFQAHPRGWGERETEQWERGHGIAESDRALGARLRALWRHVPADAEQRFGPAIILLALGGLVRRRLDRTDMLLLTMLVIQVLVWLFSTHLYARFTVPFLIPLSLLAGRAVLPGNTRRRAWITGSLLVAGAAWNFYFAACLNAKEAPDGAPAPLIYDGVVPGLEYFATVNHELPADASVLVVGEARAFYFQRTVDYCVVFNRSPFVEFVEGASNSSDIMQWLRERGFTHVLVHWNEIARLTRTYGFSPQITPQLFDGLAAVGLERIREFRHPDVSGRWVELYAIP